MEIVLKLNIVDINIRWFIVSLVLQLEILLELFRFIDSIMLKLIQNSKGYR